MILRPQRYFTIVRQIANHLDTDTYYVQAIVRDARTDEVLATLNLDDKGGQRFTKTWLVCADPSGLGRDISIVTSVYTDTGYTTKSENYGDEENTHLVEDNQPLGRGGANIGGNTGVDARTVKRIVEESLNAHHEKMMADKKEEPEAEKEEPEAPEQIDFSEVLRAIKGLETKLKPKEVKPTDLTPITKGLGELAQMIEEKEVTPETDLTPVLERLAEKGETDELTAEEMKGLLGGLEKTIITQLPKLIANVLKDAVFTIAPTTATMEGVVKDKPKKVEEPEPIDINTLTK